MKKYKIKYQDSNEIRESIIETTNISNEQLPKNIISIEEYKKTFDLNYFTQLSHIENRKFPI